MTTEEVIKNLKNIINWMKGDERWTDAEFISIETAIKAINKVESRWIPVSERLPEESTAVLIWCPARKNIYCAYLEEKQWWIFGTYQKVPFKVIAWQSLPKPYKPQKSEKV